MEKTGYQWNASDMLMTLCRPKEFNTHTHTHTPYRFRKSDYYLPNNRENIRLVV